MAQAARAAGPMLLVLLAATVVLAKEKNLTDLLSDSLQAANTGGYNVSTFQESVKQAGAFQGRKQQQQ
jgi:hypothetical protein